MTLSLIALFFGFLLDILLGDPHWMPHPVRAMGRVISRLERLLRPRCHSPRGLLLAGGCVVLAVTVLFTALPLFMLWCAQRISPWLRLAIESFFCYQILAARCLYDESMAVYRALKQEDLPASRKAVSRIVGRDTQTLTEQQVIKATVETVAENTCDGVIAPLLFLALGGAAWGFFYKAVNTMDSMLGYNNEQYQYFGRCAAKLDDVVNYIPARLSALCMLLSAAFLQLHVKNAWHIFRRDRFCHKSPNSAQTESVCAGALGIQLAGDASYFGKLVRKPTIGDPLREVEPEDIPAANRMMYGTALFALLLCAGVKGALLIIL